MASVFCIDEYCPIAREKSANLEDRERDTVGPSRSVPTFSNTPHKRKQFRWSMIPSTGMWDLSQCKPNPACHNKGSQSRLSVLLRGLLVCLAVSSLIAARSTPTHFSDISSEHSVVKHRSAHDQRPRFENAKSQWGIPIATFAGAPALTTLLPLNSKSSLRVPYRDKGAHHTRPPPAPQILL